MNSVYNSKILEKRFNGIDTSVPTKQWLEVEIGNEIVMHSLLSFIYTTSTLPNLLQRPQNNGSKSKLAMIIYDIVTHSLLSFIYTTSISSRCSCLLKKIREVSLSHSEVALETS